MEREKKVYCKNCGKEIEEGWKNCPYCGIQISDVEEAVERSADTEEETEKDLLFVKALFKAHPVRAVLCIPIILYVIIRLLGIEMDHIFTGFIQYFFEASVCVLAIYLIYGPINYKTVSGKVTTSKILFEIIASIIFWYILASVFVPGGDTDAEPTSSSGTAVVEEQKDDQKPSEPAGEMTLEEYLNSCISVTQEELNRNPDTYIGKNILLEGDFSIVADSIIIGLWDGQGGVEVKYDGKSAYNANGEQVGNVISGDYGYAAGIYRGEDQFGTPYMDGVIIILGE